ncbi:MAG: PEP-CTERM sorting domain-containing protein [Pirellulales bacterium]|nr:PEP-CTERM sorting domain-containing protein [Pirellulales bacterium]
MTLSASGTTTLEVAPVGWALSSSGLLAVPEPHTLLLASLASMGLTLRRRRWAR